MAPAGNVGISVKRSPLESGAYRISGARKAFVSGQSKEAGEC